MSPRAWLKLLYCFYVFKLQATTNQWVIKPIGLQAELKTGLLVYCRTNAIWHFNYWSFITLSCHIESSLYMTRFFCQYFIYNLYICIKWQWSVIYLSPILVWFWWSRLYRPQRMNWGIFSFSIFRISKSNLFLECEEELAYITIWAWVSWIKIFLTELLDWLYNYLGCLFVFFL